MAFRRRLTALAVSLPLLLSACGGSDPAVAATACLVAPAEAVELIAQPETVVLDVRTPDEFADGHVEGRRWNPARGLPLTSERYGTRSGRRRGASVSGAHG